MAKLPMPFSNPYTYPGHGGIDYAHPEGTPIRAVADGVISFSGVWTRAAGNTRTLTTDSGIQLMHCHLKNLAGPKVGKRVKAGEVIAYMGWTGHVVPANKNGSHLHQECFVNGVRQAGENYWKYIDRNRVIGAGAAAGSSAGGTDEGDEEFMAKIDDLWQRWQPGKAGVKTAGDLYLLFAEVVTNVRKLGASAAASVWNTRVSRGSGSVSALQELADAKTYGIQANQKLDELLKRPATSASLTDAQVAAMAKSVGDQVALSIAPKVLDAMAERLKS